MWEDQLQNILSLQKILDLWVLFDFEKTYHPFGISKLHLN